MPAIHGWLVTTLTDSDARRLRRAAANREPFALRGSVTRPAADVHTALHDRPADAHPPRRHWARPVVVWSA